MIRIHAERDSVCMGDDVTAPNADNFVFPFNTAKDALLTALCSYVPAMKNVVWEVICNKQTLGYLYSGENRQYQYEPAGALRHLSELPSRDVFCKYNYDRIGDSEDSFPEARTLLERIKASKEKQTTSAL